MNPEELGLPALLRWAMMRAAESSTWAGLAVIAMVLVSGLGDANALAEAVALIVGGGLVSAGPSDPESGGPY